MLSRLPPPLHRALLRIAHPIRLKLWGLTRREVRGCNVLAFDQQGRLLLVRHSYHESKQWLLPGGGLARGEEPAATGAREVAEEAGCKLEDGLWIGTDLRMRQGGWRNRVEIVTGMVRDEPHADGREIAEARFFPLDALPPETGAAVRTALTIREQWQASER